MNNRIMKPFEYNGELYVHSGGAHGPGSRMALKAVRVVEPDEFDGDVITYADACDRANDGWLDAGLFYYGMKVKCNTHEYIMAYPEITFVYSGEATAVSDDFTDDSPPPRLAVWALERHVSYWLDSDSPASCGFISDSLDAVIAIKNKSVGWRVPFDNIKSAIGLANYTDGDLRQAINNVINQAEITRRNARDEVQMAGLPALPTSCPECGDDIIIDQKPKPDHIGRAKLEAQCIGCARGLVWVAFVGEGQWTWNHSYRAGEEREPVRNEEQTAVSRKQMREDQIPFQAESGHIVTLNPSAFAAVKILRDRGHTVEHASPTNPGAPHDELRVWTVDGRDPINKMELWALADAPNEPAPPASATAVETATYWLKHYVDPVHNRIWADLEDNQVHHANSPCFQAFRKQYPDFKDHKALLKTALANLRREKAEGIAESIKALWNAALRLVAQASGRELIGQLNWAAQQLDKAYKMAVEAAKTAVSEEA